MAFFIISHKQGEIRIRRLLKFSRNPLQPSKCREIILIRHLANAWYESASGILFMGSGLLESKVEKSLSTILTPDKVVASIEMWTKLSEQSL